MSCEPIFFHNGEIPVHIDVLTTFGDNENNAEALCREAALFILDITCDLHSDTTSLLFCHVYED